MIKWNSGKYLLYALTVILLIAVLASTAHEFFHNHEPGLESRDTCPVYYIALMLLSAWILLVTVVFKRLPCESCLFAVSVCFTSLLFTLCLNPGRRLCADANDLDSIFNDHVYTGGRV